MSGSLRSWIHYIETRTDISTQKEHREIALLCAQKIAKIMPEIFNIISNDNKQNDNVQIQVKKEPTITISEWIGL
jgi:thymidylate synthase ThyX